MRGSPERLARAAAELVVFGDDAAMRVHGAGTYGVGGYFVHAALASAPTTRLTGVFVRSVASVQARLRLPGAEAKSEALDGAASPCIVLFVPGALNRPAHWAICRGASISCDERGSSFDGQPLLLPVRCVYYAAISPREYKLTAKQMREAGGVLFPAKSLEWLPYPGAGAPPSPSFTPLLLPMPREARVGGSGSRGVEAVARRSHGCALLRLAARAEEARALGGGAVGTAADGAADGEDGEGGAAAALPGVLEAKAAVAAALEAASDPAAAKLTGRIRRVGLKIYAVLATHVALGDDVDAISLHAVTDLFPAGGGAIIDSKHTSAAHVRIDRADWRKVWAHVAAAQAPRGESRELI